MVRKKRSSKSTPVSRRPSRRVKKRAPQDDGQRKQRDYKAEYKRRLQLGRKKGKTRQQSRGHVPQEHIIRKQRAQERQRLSGTPTHKLSTEQVISIRQWYKRFNPHAFKSIPTLAFLVDWTRERGYAAFQTYRTVWNAARDNYLKEMKAGTWASRGYGYLVGLTNQAGVRPEGEEQWLYYH